MRRIITLALTLVMLCAVQAWADKADLSGKHYYDVHKTLLYEKSKANEAGIQSEITAHKDLVYAFPHCRALVGRNCVANDIYNTVGVASWPKNLGNMTNNDLSDYTAFVNGVGAGLVATPLTSIRDLTHHYAAGTVAGFCIAQEGGTGVLSVELIKKFTLEFFCEGVKVGSVYATSGSSFNGVSLSVGSLPGSKNATCNIQAVAPDEFDEVRLVNTGVSVNLIAAIDVHYAYVGEVTSYTLTNKDKTGTVTNTMKDFDDYCTDYGLTKDKDVDGRANLVNANLTDDVPAVVLLNLGSSIPVRVQTFVKEGEPFSAGTVVGFKGSSFSVFDLDLFGGGIYIKTYDKAGKVMESYQVDQNILKLNVATGGTVNFSFITTKPFSSVSIQFLGIKLDLGATVFNYAFVTPAPDIEHHCAIDPTPDMNICEDQTSLQLYHNNTIPVTWRCIEGGASVDKDGHVTGMNDKAGTKYVFRATADDGCYDDVTVVKNQGQSSNPVQCENVISTRANGIEISKEMPGMTGALISGSKFDDGEGNLLDGNKDTYAKYIAGLQVAGHVGVVAIQTKDKAETFRKALGVESYKPLKMGFVVQSKGTGLNVNLLNGYSMEFYKAGKKVYSSTLKQANVLNLDIAGSDKLQKMEFATIVPQGIDFDQMALYHDGVLGVNASEQDFFYPFYEAGDDIDKCDDPLGCDPTLISAPIPSSPTDQSHASGASIDGNLTGNFNTVTVAGGIGNLSYLIDNNLSTGVTLGNVAQIGGGTKIAVKLGRRADYRQQLAIVMDNNNYESIFGDKSDGKGFDPLGVGVGKWMKVETYLDGVATGDTKTDWNVIGADVITTKNNNIYVWNPKKQYDEVVITIAGVLKAADVQKIYGILLQSDIDGDGVPDCKDDDSCNGDITDANNPHACKGTDITFSFKGKTGLNYYVEASDQSDDKLTATKTTNNNDGSSTYEFTVTTTKSGMYTARVMQEKASEESGVKQDGTIDYVVHPTLTHWNPETKSTDWNTWSNWIEGSPYHCTDVVIPTKAKVYPVLQAIDTKDTYDNSCNGIHFEPGAAVENVYRLNYNKAWVDMQLTNGMATLWSAPLAQVFSGDFYASEVKPENYFKDLDNTSDPDNFTVRTTPLVYQRIWKSSVKGNFTDNKSSLGDVTLISKATWSHAFNSLNQDYATMKSQTAPLCFSLMADDNTLNDKSYTLHLPKAGTRSYHYYSALGDEAGTVDVAHDESTSNKLWSSQYWTNTGEPLVLNYTNDSKSNGDGIFLVANPTMSHLDVAKFLDNEENKKVISGIKLYKQNEAFSVINVDGDLVSSVKLTDADKYVMPTAAFFVETTDKKATQLQVNYDNSMFGNQPGVKTAEPTEAKAAMGTNANALGMLRVTASNDAHTSGTVLLEGSNAKAATLMDEDYKPALAVFSIAEGRAYDIRPIDSDVVELGFSLAHADSVRLSFNAEGAADANGWMLYDRLTGNRYAPGETPTIYMEGSSIGRFYLSRMGETTAVKSISDKPGVFVTTARDKATVVSDHNDITGVEVYGANGLLVNRVNAAGVNRLTVSLQPGVMVLKVMRQGGKTTMLKLMAE